MSSEIKTLNLSGQEENSMLDNSKVQAIINILDRKKRNK